MNSVERVRAVFERKKTDRCPIDFLCTGKMQEKLLTALKLPDGEALRRFMGSDIQMITPALKRANIGSYYRHLFVRELANGRFLDNWGVTWQRAEVPSGDVFFDVVDSPLKNLSSPSELEDYPFPSAADDWDFSNIRQQTLAAGGLAVAGKTAGVFDDAWRLTGFEKMLADLYVSPELAEAVLRKVCDYWLDYGRLLLEAAGGAVDLMWTCDDLGTQNGLLMSPDVCRQFVIPLVAERAQLFKRHGARTIMHCCGGIEPIIPDLISAGVEALNPIQSAARGMNRCELKRKYGDKLVFHGSVDQQRVLVHGTVQDVIRDTKECMETLGRDGGYILAASHEIETDIPVENVKAMFLTAQEASC